MEKELYRQQYQRYAALTERRLEELCGVYLPQQASIGQAARYSLLGGGKRVRGVLVLACCALCGGDTESAADYAAAIEMLHCYSLIHDDLPCMDNDDYRRGKPSCHKQYGEHIALLAADALVTAAFEAVAGAPLPAESRVRAAALLARAAGARGMLYGQELDKRYETQKADAAQLRALHLHKTGALIAAAAAMGGAAAGAGQAQADALDAYAKELGLVFQIVDDILDVTSTAEVLGKPIGSDAANDKTTFVTLYGLDGAAQMARRHTGAACAALEPFGQAAGFLTALAADLQTRKK